MVPDGSRASRINGRYRSRRNNQPTLGSAESRIVPTERSQPLGAPTPLLSPTRTRNEASNPQSPFLSIRRTSEIHLVSSLEPYYRRVSRRLIFRNLPLLPSPTPTHAHTLINVYIITPERILSNLRLVDDVFPLPLTTLFTFPTAYLFPIIFVTVFTVSRTLPSHLFRVSTCVYPWILFLS